MGYPRIVQLLAAQPGQWVRWAQEDLMHADRVAYFALVENRDKTQEVVPVPVCYIGTDISDVSAVDFRDAFTVYAEVYKDNNTAKSTGRPAKEGLSPKPCGDCGEHHDFWRKESDAAAVPITWQYDEGECDG
jgi:hypothetical protein